MDDGFRVDLTEVIGLSDVLSGKQSEPQRMGSTLDGVSTVDTGDPSLDCAIRSAVGQSTAMLGRFGQALAQDAQALRANVDRYRSTDEQASTLIAGAGQNLTEAAQRINLIPIGTSGTDSANDQPGATPPETQPMSNLDIAGKLS